MNMMKLVKAIATKPSLYVAACVACLLLAAGVELTKVTFATNGVTYKILTDSTVQVGDGEEAAISETLKEVEIPSTVTRFKTTYTVTGVGKLAFYKCSGLTSVTLPDSVASIGSAAFTGCSNLTSVMLPDSLGNIGESAFSGCYALNSVTIPNSMTSIGAWSFSECSGLTSVTIPDSVTSIGNMAFALCSALTSVTLPDSLTSIGDGAFSGCFKLTSVTLPASLTSIGYSAFAFCPFLEAFVVHPDNPMFCTVDGVLLTKDKTRLIAYPCRKRGDSYAIPAGVASIGTAAFTGCSNLTSVMLPDSLGNIGESAFSGCSALTSVTLPASVKNVGSNAFIMCPKLTSVSVLGTQELTVDDTTFANGPTDRVLYVPNATGGFTAKKWGAAAVVYGTAAK